MSSISSTSSASSPAPQPTRQNSLKKNLDKLKVNLSHLFRTPKPVEKTSTQSSSIGEIDKREYVALNQVNLLPATIGTLAQHLHHQLSNNGEKSVCFSPLSIFSVLALVAETLNEGEREIFLETLKLKHLGIEGIRTANSALIASLVTKDDQKSFTFCHASAVAVASVVGQSFLDIARQNYYAEVFPCGQDAAAACVTINKWVSDKTCGKISELITPEDIKNELAAVLLNAIYFLGNWKYPFETSMTQPQPFYLANGDIIEVSMMKTEERFRLYTSEDNLFEMLEMPFENPHGQLLSCLIFLPNEAKNISQVESFLNLPFIKACCEKAERMNVHLKMPKIDVDIKVADLIPALKDIGGIEPGAEMPAINKNAFLGAVIHKAKLKIDERGAEGAAATAAICEMESGLMGGPKPKDFNADHNFAYVIVYGDTILFQGSVNDSAALFQNDKSN